MHVFAGDPHTNNPSTIRIIIENKKVHSIIHLADKQQTFNEENDDKR